MQFIKINNKKTNLPVPEWLKITVSGQEASKRASEYKERMKKLPED